MGEKARVYVAYLVASVQMGERAALLRLAEHWYPVLCSHAYRLIGDREAAQDIAQEAWIDIQRGLASLQDSAAFPAWSLRIVSRKVARQITSLQQRRLETSLEEPGHDSGQQQLLATSPVGDDAVLASQIRDAINRLPAAHRASLALFYQQGLSVAEIAIALDIPAGTVKSRLSTAREALKAILKED